MKLPFDHNGFEQAHNKNIFDNDSLHLLHSFLRKTKNEHNNMEATEDRSQMLKLSDETVVIEDEKKFQEYFLKEKDKLGEKVLLRPVSWEYELSLNNELIENTQEMIIENEEWVHSAQLPQQKYLKRQRNRRSLFNTLKKNVNSRIGWLFLKRQTFIGIKGGADQTHEKRLIPQEKPETSKTTEER